MWVQVVQVSPALLAFIHRVHLGMIASSLGLQDLPEVALVLWSCVPSFCPLSRFVFGALYLNVPLFRV